MTQTLTPSGQTGLACADPNCSRFGRIHKPSVVGVVHRAASIERSGYVITLQRITGAWTVCVESCGELSPDEVALLVTDLNRVAVDCERLNAS